MAEGIGVALDTCGFGNSDRLYRMAKKADYILYDMKSIDDPDDAEDVENTDN